MSVVVDRPKVLDEGTLSFTIESRILRELGERLVKQPEVAVLELVKNAYDADATTCNIDYQPTSITVDDDGSGMTLARFTDGWMRIGTSAKEAVGLTPKYLRMITGEKGIGRFAVRFLGRTLHLESVADDRARKSRTRLVADFDWLKFDELEDLGQIKVPYRLIAAERSVPTGTRLVIGNLREEVSGLDLKKVRNGSIGVLSPVRSLFLQTSEGKSVERAEEATRSDPGFVLRILNAVDDSDEDVAAKILDGFVLRARLRLTGDSLT